MQQKQVNTFCEKQIHDSAVFPDFRELHTMRITAVFHTIFSLTAVLSIIGILAALPYRMPYMILTFCVFLAASLGYMIISHLYYRRKKSTGLYHVPCSVAQAQNIACFFHAKPVDDCSYSSVFMQEKTTFCTNIYCVGSLNSGSLKQVKRTAKKAAAKENQSVSAFSAGKYARIDVILCDSVESGFLVKTANNARRLLDRSECLFEVVMCRRQKNVFIPHIFDELDYLQVKRYTQFCGIISRMIIQFRDANGTVQNL